MSNHGALTPRQSASSSTAGASTSASSFLLPPPSLLCNRCSAPLATTCFLCACDCVFCEECTYSHFERDSKCPVCSKTLGENDFTELVVAEGTGPTNDIAKTSLQALFSKQSKTTTKALPLSDICFTLVRQMDVVKQSTKFLLKQLLMNGNAQGRNVAKAMRYNEQLKSQITQLKQEHSSQRLQFEQLGNDLNNRLKARENTIRELNEKLQEKNKILSQFRNMHHSDTSGGRMATPDCDTMNNMLVQNQLGTSNVSLSHHPTRSVVCNNILQDSSSNHGGDLNMRSAAGSSSLALSVSGTGGHPSAGEPPLKGLMMKRDAQHAMQQQAFHQHTRRGPNISSSTSVQSSITGMSNVHVGPRATSARLGGIGVGRGGTTMGHSVTTQRFSSAHSTGSNSLNSVTPRVRDLSHNRAFTFSGGSVGSGSGRNSSTVGGGSGGGHRGLNKRRRIAEATPLATHTMSPNTAFTLNQGNYSVHRGGRGGGGGDQMW